MAETELVSKRYRKFQKLMRNRQPKRKMGGRCEQILGEIPMTVSE